MRKTILVVTALLAALAAYAAPPADNVVSVPTPPTGACREGQTLVLAKSNGHVYGCVASAWHDWTAAALAAVNVNVNAITGDVAVTGVVAAGGGVDLDGDGTPELSRGSTPEGGGGSAPSVVLRGTSGSPALSFFPGHLDLDTPLHVPSLDLTGDGTADITWDATEGVVSIVGHPTHPLLRVMIPMPGATSGISASVTTWTIGATAVASSWGNGVGRGSWRMAANTNPSAIGTTLMVPPGWTSGRLDLQGVWQSASGEAVGLTAAWRLAAVCAPVLKPGTTTPYVGATTAGTREASDVWGVNTMALTLTIPNVGTNCPAGSGLTVYLQRLPNDALDTLVADADVLGGVVALW